MKIDNRLEEHMHEAIGAGCNELMMLLCPRCGMGCWLLRIQQLCAIQYTDPMYAAIAFL